MATGGRDQSITGGHELFYEWKCNKCEENDRTTEGIAYCRNCSKCYCDSCLRNHSWFVKDHTVLGEADKDDWGKPTASQDSGMECSEHKGQSIAMYCGRHDVVCCPVCAYLHHGDTCKPNMSYIPTVAQGIVSSTEFKTFIATNDDLLGRLMQTETERTDCLSTLSDSRENCKEDIEKMRQNLTRRLEELQQISFTNMNTTFDDEKDTIQADIAQCVELRHKLNVIKQQMQTSFPVNESSLFVKMKTSGKVHLNCDELCKALSYKRKKTYFFKQDSDLQRLFMTSSLGVCTEQIIEMMDEAAEEAKLRTKETLTNIHLIDTKMLLAIKYPTQMEEKYKDLKVKINQNKIEIVFEGLGKDIHAAKLDMYEMKDKFAKRIFKDIPLQSLGMYQLQQVKEYIVKTLKQKNVPAVWDVEDIGLVVCSASQETLVSSIESIRDAVKENSLPPSKASRSIVLTDEWDNMVQNLQVLHPGKVMVTVADMSRVVISSTDDVEQEAVKAVKRFINDKAILDETVQLSASVSQLLSQHHRTEVDNIAKSLVSDHVQIIWNQRGFCIRGNEKGVAGAKIQQEQLASQIISKEHIIDKPGSGQYFSQQTGRDSIRTVETQLPCVVRLKGEEDDDSGPLLLEAAGGGEGDYGTGSALPHGTRLHASCVTPDDRKIFTVEGDMTDMRVDALVNTADKKLSLVGGLGKVIVTKGGKAVRDACAKFIGDYGTLEEGSVFLSPGGDLNAGSVIHVVGPAWQNGYRNERARLKEAVSKVMKQATLKHVSSIAIPAISCGTFGFPSKVATSVIVQAVQNFFREEQDSPIQFIYLCDGNQNILEGFTEALKACCGPVKMSPFKVLKGQRPPRAVSTGSGSDSGTDYEVVDDDSDDDVQDSGSQDRPFGDIKVVVKSGDITREACDCIVNSSNEDLNLS